MGGANDFTEAKGISHLTHNQVDLYNRWSGGALVAFGTMSVAHDSAGNTIIPTQNGSSVFTLNVQVLTTGCKTTPTGNRYTKSFDDVGRFLDS